MEKDLNKEIPCYALKLKTKEAYGKKEELKKLYESTFCSGVKVEHFRIYLIYRSEEMRDAALAMAREIFKWAKIDSRICWVREKYLDPKGR